MPSDAERLPGEPGLEDVQARRSTKKRSKLRPETPPFGGKWCGRKQKESASFNILSPKGVETRSANSVDKSDGINQPCGGVGILFTSSNVYVSSIAFYFAMRSDVSNRFRIMVSHPPRRDHALL